PGRAMMLVFPWHGKSLNILNIYAPNRPEERDEMWRQLWELWAKDPLLPFPHITFGDWNFVEDPLDRNSGAVEPVPESYRRLKSLLHLHDGWRDTFPDTRDYTCSQHRKDRESDHVHISYSRIDRIYIDHQQREMYRDWTIKHCSVKSDHRLITAQLACRPEEKPGNGRWSMPLYLLKTKKFMDQVQTLATQLVKDLDRLQLSHHHPEENIQTLWAKFKLDVTTYGKHCSRFI
ncbi:hypothetical protein B0H17DRAFT_846418, partial [Mycena rosella]